MSTKYVGVILIMAALIAMMLLVLLMGPRASHATATSISMEARPYNWHYYMGRGELDGRCGWFGPHELCIWDRAKI